MRIGSIWVFAATLSLVSPATADDASRLATARELVRVTHSADNLRAMLPQLMNAVRPMLMQQGADQKTVDSLLQDGASRMAGQTDQLVDLIANIYAQEFSEEDLDNLLAFDKTPSGQHLIEKQGTLMRGMLVIGKQWGQAVAKQVIDDYARRKAGATTLTP